jgi:hypothetical protein
MTQSDDQRSIEFLKRSYFRGVDNRDWATFASIFDAAAVMDMSAATDPPIPPVHGREQIVDQVKRSLEGLTTIHHAFLETLEYPNADTARAVWKMEDLLLRAEGGQMRKFLHGHGHYHEEYRRTRGGWLYSSVRLTRVYVETFC